MIVDNYQVTRVIKEAGMSGSKMRLPDVIGIGSRRCASSSLHHWLNQHPDIGKPPRGLHFFSEQFSSGLTWYQEELAPYANKQVLLEYSVSYSYPEYYEATAERIYKLVPHAKLFISVRNPIERAFSDYLRSLRLCEIEKEMSLEQALEYYPIFLERGFYYRILSHYLEFFPRENLQILFFEDLKAGLSAYLQTLLDFIGVDQSVQFRPTKRSSGGPKRLRWSFFNRSVFAMKNSMDELACLLSMRKGWKAFKEEHLPLYKWLLALNMIPIEINAETRKSLRSYYEADIQGLEKLTGRSLDNWR